MGDAENALPPSKKRAAGRQLSRDNPGLDDEEETSEREMGSFKRASDEVMASRKIVKVRRHQTPSAPSPNPFAGIRLVQPADSNTALPGVTPETEMPGKENSETDDEQAHSQKVEDKNDFNEDTDKKRDEDDTQLESKVDEPGAESTKENEKTDGADKATKSEQADVEAVEGEKTLNEAKNDAKDEGTDNEDQKANGSKNIEKSKGTASFNSFQQLSCSQNAFTGLAGTGFSGSTFSFGLAHEDGSSLISRSGSSSLFGLKNDHPFGFGLSNNGNSSLFGTSEALASVVNKSEGSGFPAMREVPVETGEENENVVFTADSVLFEFLDGVWKERGKGEVKVNVSTTSTGKARLVMRAKGNYRLILNASLYPDMKLTNMDKRGITFACVNSIGEAKGSLSTFALKFKDNSIVEEFCAVVTEHKGKTAVAVKTPENSPKSLDD